MPSLTYPIKYGSPLHKTVVSKLSSYIKWADKAHKDMHEEWRQAEQTMMAYVPEKAADRRRRSMRDDGDPQVTTMIVPYSYAVTMSAHTYFSSVMLGREPVHQFMGRHGEGQDKVNAIEALLSYQTSFGGATIPYYSWLYDGGRYGFGFTRTIWEKEVRQVASIIDEEMPATTSDGMQDLFGDTPTKSMKRLIVEEVEVYEGNKVINCSPFDIMTDPRVPLQDFQKGEFFIHRVNSLGWIHVVEKREQGYYMNVEEIKTQSGNTTRSSYEGDTSRPRPQDYQFDPDPSGSDDKMKRPGAVSLYEVYVKMIPSEWKLGTRTRPEMWCFTITQDLAIVIGATPCGYYHANFPFDLVKIDPDPYTLGARGFPKQLEGVQNTMDWLVNTHYYNIRAALQNLFIVDPTRVNLTDLEDPLPGGIIRVRLEAAGMDVRTAVHQIPIQDVTQQHLRELPIMQGIGERIVGVNDGVMGSGGSDRKTATEVRTTTGFSVNRLKTITEFMSQVGMGPHAQKMVQNSQQFYSGEKKFRIAGDMLIGGAKDLLIDPAAIAGFYDFVHVDGAMPVDRMAEAKMIQELIMQLAAFPQMAMQYDMGRMLAYAMVRGGMKNIHQFRIDVRPDAQIATELQGGNIVPFQTPPATPASRAMPSLGNSTGASGPIA